MAYQLDLGRVSRTEEAVPSAPILWRTGDWVAGSFAEGVWTWISLDLFVLAISASIVYLAGQERTADAEAAVRERAQTFTSAPGGGHGDAACEMLGDQAKDDGDVHLETESNRTDRPASWGIRSVDPILDLILGVSP